MYFQIGTLKKQKNRIGYNRKPMLRDILENGCSGKEDFEAATGGVFQRNLQNFYEYLFHRTSSDDCL